MRFFLASAALCIGLFGGEAVSAEDVPPNISPRANLKGHAKAVWCVACSQDGKILATGGGNLRPEGNNPGELILWSPATGKRLATLPSQGGRVRAVAFSPDGKILAACYEPENIIGRGQTVLWNVATRTPMGKNPFAAHALAFSGDGKLLAMGGSGPPPPFPQGGQSPDRIDVWDVKGSVKTATMSEGHPRGVDALAFSPDGRLIAAGSPDGTAILWDAQTGRLTTSLPVKLGFQPSLAFSPDGLTLAMGTRNEMQTSAVAGEVTLLDLKTAKVRLKLSLSTRNSDENVNTMTFSPDGKLLAVGTGWSGDGEVFLLDPVDGRRIANLRGHKDVVKGVAFSADNRTLASGSTDGAVLLWDVSPKRLVDAAEKPPEFPAGKPKAELPADTPAGRSKATPEKLKSTTRKPPPVELPAGKFPEPVVRFHKSMAALREREAVRLEKRIGPLKESVRLGGRDMSPEAREAAALLRVLTLRLKLVKSDQPYVPRLSPKDFAIGQIGELDDDLQLNLGKNEGDVTHIHVMHEELSYFTGKPGIWGRGKVVGDHFKVRAAFAANLQPMKGEYDRASPNVRLLRSHVYEVVEGTARGAVTDYTLAPFKMDEVTEWLRKDPRIPRQ